MAVLRLAVCVSLAAAAALLYARTAAAFGGSGLPVSTYAPSVAPTIAVSAAAPGVASAEVSGSVAATGPTVVSATVQATAQVGATEVTAAVHSTASTPFVKASATVSMPVAHVQTVSSSASASTTGVTHSATAIRAPNPASRVGRPTTERHVPTGTSRAHARLALFGDVGLSHTPDASAAASLAPAGRVDFRGFGSSGGVDSGSSFSSDGGSAPPVPAIVIGLLLLATSRVGRRLRPAAPLARSLALLSPLERPG